MDAKKRNVCFTCKHKTALLFFVCKHCNNMFCTHHRLPETHLCDKMDEFINKEKLLLSEKLKQETLIKAKVCSI